METVCMISTYIQTHANTHTQSETQAPGLDTHINEHTNIENPTNIERHTDMNSQNKQNIHINEPTEVADPLHVEQHEKSVDNSRVTVTVTVMNTIAEIENEHENAVEPSAHVESKQVVAMNMTTRSKSNETTNADQVEEAHVDTKIKKHVTFAEPMSAPATENINEPSVNKIVRRTVGKRSIYKSMAQRNKGTESEKEREKIGQQRKEKKKQEEDILITDTLWENDLTTQTPGGVDTYKEDQYVKIGEIDKATDEVLDKFLMNNKVDWVSPRL